MATNKIIEAARAAGITFEEDSHGRGEPPFNAERPSADDLARFYAIARAEALEDAAKVFDRRAVMKDGGSSVGWYEPDEPAQILRALKEQQHG